MRIQLIVLALLLSAPLAAQRGGGGAMGGGMSGGMSGGRGGGGRGGRGGGIHPGRPSNPFPLATLPVPSPAVGAAWLGLNPLWGTLTPSFPPWTNLALTGAPVFGPTWCPPFSNFASYGGYGDSYYPPPYYPPPQAPSNVTVVLPPQAPVVLPAPVPVPIVAREEPPVREVQSAPPEPIRELVVPEESPAIVAVKGGNLYSVVRYWHRGKTFHFVTTGGEEHEIPVSRLERLYPARRKGSPVDP